MHKQYEYMSLADARQQDRLRNMIMINDYDVEVVVANWHLSFSGACARFLCIHSYGPIPVIKNELPHTTEVGFKVPNTQYTWYKRP